MQVTFAFLAGRPNGNLEIFVRQDVPIAPLMFLTINWRFQFNGILEIFANGNLENPLQILASQECSNDGHDIFGLELDDCDL